MVRKTFQNNDLIESLVYKEVFQNVDKLGPNICLVYSFIKYWTPDITKYSITVEPDWYREDIDIKTIASFCDKKKVPLIAICRGLNDDTILKEGLLMKMINDVQ